jgi:hypothetical protein
MLDTHPSLCRRLLAAASVQQQQFLLLLLLLLPLPLPPPPARRTVPGNNAVICVRPNRDPKRHTAKRTPDRQSSAFERRVNKSSDSSDSSQLSCAPPHTVVAYDDNDVCPPDA